MIGGNATLERPGEDTAPTRNGAGTPPVPIRENFETFYLREFPKIVAITASMSNNRSIAEDVAQNAMIKAHRHWDKISGYDKPGAWVRRVAINEATSVLRRKTTEARALLRMGPQSTVELPPAPPEDESIWRAVADLPKKQRAAVALHYLEDRSTKEIAEVLDCSEATARVHLHRGRQRLAERLEDVR